MTSVEMVKKICKDRKIPISKLEKDLGFSNGYIGQLRKGVFPTDRATQIANYLNVPLSVIAREESPKEDSDGLNARDRRDIAKDLDDIMEKLESGDEGPLRYNGEQIDDETLIKVRAALEFGLTQLKKENKVLYNPNKNKKQD